MLKSDVKLERHANVSLQRNGEISLSNKQRLFEKEAEITFQMTSELLGELLYNAHLSGQSAQEKCPALYEKVITE